ncbi:Tyrosine-protein phosphatase YwqE [Parabacteroides distasonis]|nr:Tyrosine-protein phosphatase YwqE [Parabacteroides distasonis]
MWPLKKRISLKESGIFEDFTDCHSHILPGVDDGVQTMEEALEILRLYEELGIKSVWLTPHIMEDMPNTTTHLRERYAELQAAYSGPIKLHLASENMLDNLFEERLEKNDLLPLGKNNDHLLVETSYFSPPMGLSNILLRIKAKGYYPVLAHPERYVYMGESDYRQLKDMGVKFQLNLFALTGLYGPNIKGKAGWLLKKHLYDLTGSDIHHLMILKENVYKQKLSQTGHEQMFKADLR